jgi:cytochrome c553
VNIKLLQTGMLAAVLLVPVASIAGGDAAKGEELSATCAACHGADGNSTIPTNPILACQYESYLEQALNDYKSGARNNAIMAGFAAALSKQDIKDLAAYFSSQESTLYVPDR